MTSVKLMKDTKNYTKLRSGKANGNPQISPANFDDYNFVLLD